MIEQHQQTALTPDMVNALILALPGARVNGRRVLVASRERPGEATIRLILDTGERMEITLPVQSSPAEPRQGQVGGWQRVQRIIRGLLDMPEDASLVRYITRCLGVESLFLLCWAGVQTPLVVFCQLWLGMPGVLVAISLSLTGLNLVTSARLLWRASWVLMESLGSLWWHTWTSPATLAMIRMLTGLLLINGVLAVWFALVTPGPRLPTAETGAFLVLGALLCLLTGFLASWVAQRFGWHF